MKSLIRTVFLSALIVCLTTMAVGCSAKQQLGYYSQRENYVTVTGVVSHISYNREQTALYLGFDMLDPTMDDSNFKIVGDNLLAVRAKGIDNKIKIGTEVEFVTAPRYFGDGYVMPIVSICIDGEELLGVDAGIQNFLAWLKNS